MVDGLYIRRHRGFLQLEEKRDLKNISPERDRRNKLLILHIYSFICPSRRAQLLSSEASPEARARFVAWQNLGLLLSGMALLLIFVWW